MTQRARLHGTKNIPATQLKRRHGMRRQVLLRDGGVCAHCKLDTEKLISEEREKTGKSRGDVIAAICWDWGVSNGAGSTRRDVRATLWIADHIVPLGVGGRDTLGNMQTLCLACNLNKTIKDIGDTLRSRHKARRIVGKIGSRGMRMRQIREAQFIEETDEELDDTGA